MKVQHPSNDTCIYSVKWYYSNQRTISSLHTGKNEEYTKCIIIDSCKPEEKIESSVSRHINDRPNRNKARQAALRKAISLFPKNIRTAFWQAYKNLSPKREKW